MVMEEENPFLKYEELKPDELPTPVSDVLETFFPPRTIQVEDKEKELHISSKPPIIFEVYDLKSAFEKKLQENECEIGGFSPTLRKIHDQLFEELIRQEIIVCKERGLLLQRIRNDILTNLESIQEVCKSTFSYGVCKKLTSFWYLKKMENEIPVFRERIERAKERFSNLIAEQDQKRKNSIEEGLVKAVEREFLEEQVKKDNTDTRKNFEEKIDEEQRWLKESM